MAFTPSRPPEHRGQDITDPAIRNCGLFVLLHRNAGEVIAVYPRHKPEVAREWPGIWENVLTGADKHTASPFHSS